MVKVPRIVVGAPASGQGKTTVAVGIMAALTRSGLAVSPGKVGPDYIDPGYHALATGRAGRNLDPWLLGPERIGPMMLHGFLTPGPADVAVIEGVMGLFDGQIGGDGFASTAHVAQLTSSPVVLVVDISSTSRTVAAIVHGLRSFDPSVNVVGVVLNKAGSTRHASEARQAIEGIGVEVLGVLPRDATLHVPSRHLGLVPAAERADAAAAMERLAEQTAQHLDLTRLMDVAQGAPDLHDEPWRPPRVAATLARPRIAIAGGRAFTFRYAETEELLRATGCETVIFDPANDVELPPGTHGLYLGGGFPEAHTAALAGNRRLLREIRDAVEAGMPTVAECAGLLYLAQSLDGYDLVGAVPTTATMGTSLVIGYRSATLATDSVLGHAGVQVHAHEFHRTRTASASVGQGAWDVGGMPVGFALDPASTGRATLHASYLHVHWAGSPGIGLAFADAASAFAASPVLRGEVNDDAVVIDIGECERRILDPLEHHGDVELEPGLIDLAVNVRLPRPPAWLMTTIEATLPGLGRYPDARAARSAIARRHGVPESMVLPTSGGAEAFTLIARAIDGRRPVVIHPQFTEPEAALRRAGRVPERLLLLAGSGFGFREEDLGVEGDLVFVGNPTNPSGVMHSRADLESLRTGGRVLVVDEAFMDAVPGEPETLINPSMDNLLVLRSLTKTWGIAGLRAGYVVGDPRLIAQLAGQQPHWSVSAPAAAAMVATATPRALAEAEAASRTLAQWRAHLVHLLDEHGYRSVPGVAPFVLVEVAEGVRERLRKQGFAVRRCDTFPGLDDRWIRVAVREPQVSDDLAHALLRTRVDDAFGSAHAMATAFATGEST